MDENNFDGGGWTVVGKKQHGKKNKSTFNNFSSSTYSSSNQHGDHQDWSTTTIGRKNTKPRTTTTSYRTHEDKIANDEDYSVRKYKHEFINMVKQKRNEKGWNQVALSQKLGMKPDVVKNFESGKSSYEPSLVSALRRVLNIGKEVKA